MKIGTKSVLFGAHCFLFHWVFVAAGWWKLHGWSSVEIRGRRHTGRVSLWYPWLWIAFLVHDIGYLGKPNMDGPEGEMHPWTGARILYRLQGWWLFVTRLAWDSPERFGGRRPPRRWELRRRLAIAHLLITSEPVCWGNEVLFHSRFLAKQYGVRPSVLCIADKLAIALTPAWLYLPLVRATGEIREYMAKSSHMNETGGKYAGMQLSLDDERQWHRDMCAYVRRWVEEHKDGREDTWTPDSRVARTESGVWQ